MTQLAANTASQPRVFVLIPTHTTRHLRACVASVAGLNPKPDGIVVTCDVIDDSISELLDTTWRECNTHHGPLPKLVHTFREHQGTPMLNQVRNNGLRALDKAFSLHEDDMVVVLDGDTLLNTDAVAHYQSHAGNRVDLVIPFRVYLTESQTKAIDADALVQHPADIIEPLVPATESNEYQILKTLQTKYAKHLWLREHHLSMLIKSHKPKIIGGHHGVRMSALRRVNGYDEQYTKYGFDDDDLCRRLYQLRPRIRAAVAITDIIAMHLWHPTRAPEKATHAPGWERFSRTDLPAFCEHGLTNPVDQPEPIVRIIGT
ncbi:MAG: glycosyltransferase family 2 protein [Phycisphaeraceae bacterium]|nr:glycosyltransferase family 2 protein [Phycisphaerales bacterium]MCB9859455.1 glycosyltransferase family 2 protein [Phycisphaeraceae bacterium]